MKINTLISKHILALLIILLTANTNTQYVNQFDDDRIDKYQKDFQGEDDVVAALANKFRNREKCLKNPTTYKFLLMYKKIDIKWDTNHILNKLNYKTIVFTNNELAVFKSNNPTSANPDFNFDSSSYILTLLYSTIDLPCLNRSFVCTHNQLVREYQVLYPEIDYTVSGFKVAPVGSFLAF